jgi:FMN phosphatase YigB (HAD superfamily)
MVRILMLDLGNTLIGQDNNVFPYVREALETLQGFETGAHEQLSLCLISDYQMPTPQKTVQSLFQEYVTLLESVDLARFFEPVEQHVTLSTHAGVNKPDRRIFELAIKRLGLTARLDECIFITENTEHIEACRVLGIKTMQFDEGGSGGDFSDWSEAPLLIAQIVNPESTNNLENALRLRLSVAYDVEFITIMDRSEDGTIRGRAKIWQHVSASEAGGGPGSQVTLSVDVEIEMDSQGRVLAVKSKQPDKEQADEASHYIKTLEENKQISRKRGPLSPGETHRETENEKGEKRIKRERFSSI